MEVTAEPGSDPPAIWGCGSGTVLEFVSVFGLNVRAETLGKQSLNDIDNRAETR